MAKIDKRKQYFFLCDTETTTENTIADFAGVIVDKKGKIYNQIAVLVDGHYGKHELFHDVKSAEEIWTLRGLKKRNEVYKGMLNSRNRMLAAVPAINRWIELAQKTYPNLVFCAYNSPFDLDKMKKTGIHQGNPEYKSQQLVDLEKTGVNVHGFHDYFCLWAASVDRLKGDKEYINHCLSRKWVTTKLNIRTNAEAVAEYACGHDLPAEPHTALEDVLYYELGILKWLLKSKSYKKYSQQCYNWYDWRLKNLVTAK